MTGLAAGTFHQPVRAPSPGPGGPGGPNTPVPVAQVLKGGTNGVSYSETISAQGGSGTGYTYSLFSGSLPTGTSLTGATGVIAGTASAAGTFSFVIEVTDSLGQFGSQAFSITIANPSAGGGSWTYAS